MRNAEQVFGQISGKSVYYKGRAECNVRVKNERGQGLTLKVAHPTHLRNGGMNSAQQKCVP